jgi:hypothetical protein
MRYLILTIILFLFTIKCKSQDWWETKYDKSQRVHYKTKSKDWISLESFCSHLSIKYDSLYIKAGKSAGKLWKSVHIKKTNENMYFIFEDNSKILGLHYHQVEKSEIDELNNKYKIKEKWQSQKKTQWRK